MISIAYIGNLINILTLLSEILIVTTGGKLLADAHVEHPYRIVKLLQKDSLDLIDADREQIKRAISADHADKLQRVCLAIDQATKRPGDLTFRYGGDEIAVVLPNTDSSSAYVITEAMRKAVLELNIPHEGSQLDTISTVTISVGVVTIIPERDTKASDLLQLADDALYQAKGDGRNRVVASAVDELIER